MKGSLLLYNLKLNCLIFFYRYKQLADYIYMDIYCELSKCIGQTPCSYEHYLVHKQFLEVRPSLFPNCTSEINGVLSNEYIRQLSKYVYDGIIYL